MMTRTGTRWMWVPPAGTAKMIFALPSVLQLFGAFAPTAAGGTLPKNFTLGRYIPADVWLYVHQVHNPERAFLAKEWAEVLEAFKDAGIIDQVKNLLVSTVPSEERAQVEAALSNAVGLWKGVRWSDLVRHEFAFGYRMNPPKTASDPNARAQAFPDYILLCRAALDTLDANMAGLAAILKQIAPLKEGIELTRVEGAQAHWSLTFAGAPTRLDLFRKNDIVGLVIGHGVREEVMDLMSGKGGGGAIVDVPRFREALAKTPAPEDGLTFFDVKMLLSDLRGYMRQPKDELRVIGKLIDLGDYIDYVMVTEETEGRRTLTHEVVTVQPGREDSPLAQLCADRRPFERFDAFIPVHATGFSMSTAVDFGRLYELIIDFIRDEVPDGAGIIAQLESRLGQLGFDPQRDVFSWLSGEYIAVSMPPAVVTPFGGGDRLIMIRVKNAELAVAKVKAGLDKLSAFLAERGQTLLITPATDVEAKGFKTITHPSVMMFLRPVIGFTGQWLVASTSANAVNECLKTAAGKTPSIVKNERFAAEGLMPKGPVVAASFRDTSNMAQELGAGIAMAGMLGVIIPASPETAPLREVMGILARLGPVIQKLDFFSSEASITTTNGLDTRTERVITYRNAETSKRRNAETLNRRNVEMSYRAFCAGPCLHRSRASGACPWHPQRQCRPRRPWHPQRRRHPPLVAYSDRCNDRYIGERTGCACRTDRCARTAERDRVPGGRQERTSVSCSVTPPLWVTSESPRRHPHGAPMASPPATFLGVRPIKPGMSESDTLHGPGRV